MINKRNIRLLIINQVISFDFPCFVKDYFTSKLIQKTTLTNNLNLKAVINHYFIDFRYQYI